ncbi:MAG: YicC family protein [Yoonia sp.]|nr:YicC family protein [Yoonia sp.]
MIRSMTAYASRTGQLGPHSWAWEMRGVNARGLDLRVRIPDWLDGLESKARAAMGKAMARGNVTLNLRITREEGAQTMQIDPAQLDVVLAALDTVQERAFAMGVKLAQPNAADVLGQKGVMVQGSAAADDNTALIAALSGDLDALITDFVAMRAAEGAALGKVVQAQIDQIATLTAQATTAAKDRKSAQQHALTDAMARVLQDVADVDPDRLAQELALLAVKSDITEEIDRLSAHVTAANALLNSAEPVGRKLDFLSQEFNREANTLCSKAGAAALTAIGLDLKAVIDQMREQIQNVE